MDAAVMGRGVLMCMYYGGYSYNYSKATDAYGTQRSTTRMNQNHAYNAVGSLPQVTVSSTTYLAFEAFMLKVNLQIPYFTRIN